MAAKKKTAAKKTVSRKSAPKKKTVSKIPKGYGSVTCFLVCKDAAAAIAFYKKAFGVKEHFRLPLPDGSVAHAELQLGDTRLMIAEANPQWGQKGPLALGGSPISFCIYTADSDKLFAQAVAAGATAKGPMKNEWYGDRLGRIADPFGFEWTIATRFENVSPKEMLKRMSQTGPS